MPNELQDKYNTLLAAVHALDPFDDDFCTDEDGDCTSCDMSHPKHVYDCPVTRLRDILNAQYAPVDIAFLDDHIKSPTDNGVS